MSRKTYLPFYKRHNLKHITGYLTLAQKKRLQQLAKESDKSLTRYVTRLLEKHIKEHEKSN